MLIDCYLCGPLWIWACALLQESLENMGASPLGQELQLIWLLVCTIWLTSHSEVDIHWYHITSALTPFWDSQTTFWALAGITDMSKLGYSYPDFNGLDILNLDTTKAVINARIYELYGGSSTSSAFLAVPKHLLSNEVTDDIQPSVSLDQGIWEWMACVEFKKYELGTSFFVFIFLGEVSKNPLEWCVSPNYVRGHHALAFINSFSDSCANCISQQDLVEEGFVHLKYAIARHLGLGSLEPNTLELYLTDNLQWRVQKVFS